VDVQVTNKRVFAYGEEMKEKLVISMEEELGLLLNLKKGWGRGLRFYDQYYPARLESG